MSAGMVVLLFVYLVGFLAWGWWEDRRELRTLEILIDDVTAQTVSITLGISVESVVKAMEKLRADTAKMLDVPIEYRMPTREDLKVIRDEFRAGGRRGVEN